MHYYIDGYNLLFRLSYNHTSLQKEREQIIHELSCKFSFLKLNATLVFDSIHAKGESTSSHVKDLLVVYTREGQTADEWIITSLEHTQTPSQNTVVSSDKQLTQNALAIGAKALSIETFVLWLNTRIKNKKLPKKKIELLPLPKKQQETPLLPPEKGSMEYYLNAFQDAHKQDSIEPLPSAELKISIPKKILQNKMSDHERWLRIFEERST
ncbi:MAG: NYN domain-containing protein [Chlamydiales bacterium]|nr:NYN domain-containing protein [Chlamydiales bacterium]